MKNYIKLFGFTFKQVKNSRAYRKYLEDSEGKIEGIKYDLTSLILNFELMEVYDLYEELGFDCVQAEITDEGYIYNRTWKIKDKFYTCYYKWQEYDDGCFRQCGYKEVKPVLTTRYV